VAERAHIRVLDDQVIDQIAAGEVVRRPASAVKELVENALDAGAQSVRVSLVDGGRSSIRVVDDGQGMDRDDALMCVERHATSKIRLADELADVRTLGFRGEALASIASVSRFDLITRAAGSEVGTRVRLEGGGQMSVAHVAAPVGTSITARSLFFNLPVRRTFLRTRATEQSHCVDAVVRQALGRPDVAFHVSTDGRRAVDAPATGQLAERVHAVLGVRSAVGVAVDASAPALSVRGVLYPHEHRSSASGALFLFVNGRFVRDRILNRAIYAAYGAGLPRGRHPMGVLHLQVPPGAVDVNIHPSKTEVRFHSPRAVATALEDAVSRALGSTGTPAPRNATRSAAGMPLFSPSRVDAASDPRAALVVPPMPEPTGMALHEPPPPPTAVPTTRVERPPFVPSVPAHPDDDPRVGSPPSAPPSVPAAAGSALLGLLPLGRASGVLLAMRGELLVAVDLEDASRALVRHRIDRDPASAPLLMPVRVTLEPRLVEALSRRTESLQALGVRIDKFSGAAVVVRGLPHWVEDPDLNRLVRAMATASDPKEALVRVLAGPGWLPDEDRALIAALAEAPNGDACLRSVLIGGPMRYRHAGDQVEPVACAEQEEIGAKDRDPG
jgi:DNA mismatch repair protein MutL